MIRNILLKYQRYLPVIALILSSIAISIRSKDGGVKLVLGDYPALIFFLIIISSILIALYFQLNSQKITSLLEQIKEQSDLGEKELESLLASLTERQREVYDLIISGKSNKEIMSTLFIEQSTLKSHINQIYRKLNIKSRRELKSKSKA